jgi:hypothetical protein
MEPTLESTWVLQSSLEPLWEALFAVQSWPSWWPGVGSVKTLAAGDEYGVAAVYGLNCELELRTCEVIAPHLLEFVAGPSLARWALHEEGGFSFAHLSVWRYRGPEAAFARAMQAGAWGLANHLGVRLVEAGSWSAAGDETTARRIEV